MANEGAPQDAATSLPAGGATGTGQADAQNYNSSSTITSTEDGFAATTEITINIKTLRGNDFKLEVAPDMAVSALKTLVRERTGVDEVRQQLPVVSTLFLWLPAYFRVVVLQHGSARVVAPVLVCGVSIWERAVLAFRAA